MSHNKKPFWIWEHFCHLTEDILSLFKIRLKKIPNDYEIKGAKDNYLMVFNFSDRNFADDSENLSRIPTGVPSEEKLTSGNNLPATTGKAERSFESEPWNDEFEEEAERFRDLFRRLFLFPPEDVEGGRSCFGDPSRISVITPNVEALWRGGIEGGGPLEGVVFFLALSHCSTWK